MPVIIKSKREGFRRAGAAHPAEATEYPDGHWSAEDLKILEAEPMLEVVVSKAKADKADKDKDSDKGKGK